MFNYFGGGESDAEQKRMIPNALSYSEHLLLVFKSESWSESDDCVSLNIYTF